MLPGKTDRRQFLQLGAVATGGVATTMSLVEALQAEAPKLKKNKKAIIILTMGGGASTLDMFSPLYDHPNNGPFKAIKTTVAGMDLHEPMVNLAKQAKHFAIIRSLSTTEGDHNRASMLMRTGFSPNPMVQYPSMGSMIAYQFKESDGDLPSYVSTRVGISREAGFLGAKYGPIEVLRAGTIPENLTVGREAEAPPLKKADPKGKGGAVPKVGKEPAKTPKEREAAKAAAQTAARIKVAFSLNSADDAKMIVQYGDNQFGKGCLLARKLVEAGTIVVNVSLGGWDMHANIFESLHKANGTGAANIFDKACAALFDDLQNRGMLQDTVVLFNTEFSRTPRINANGGRDHHPRAWSIILGGGSIKGGQVYGSLDKSGEEVKENKVSVNDVFATVYKAMGLDPTSQVRDNFDQQVTISGPDGKVIKALTG